MQGLVDPPPPPPIGEEEPTAMPSSTSSSTLTEFSPEAHSWILVPDSPNAAPAVLGSTTPLLAAVVEGMTATATSVEDTTPTQTLSPDPHSPTQLRESLTHELAVSEILSAESQWPLPLSQTAAPTPPLTSSDASYQEPSPALYFNETHQWRKLNHLAFVPPAGDAHCGKVAFDGGLFGGLPASLGGAADNEDAASDGGSELDALVCLPWGPWAKPLTVIAVLLASHAAVFAVGVALGRQQDKSSAVATEGCLTRRFSSGAGGMHSRLCMA